MTKKIKENMSFVSNLAHSLVIEWKMSTILMKMFCQIQNGRTLQKKHICMQNKLHAEQFSLFPSIVGIDKKAVFLGGGEGGVLPKKRV